jgi:outer membrane protein assembly factor BamD (BamD/ComL family)
MSETYELFQQGRDHLKKGMAAQATVALEKAKRREPDKASIREALGIAYFRLRRYEEAEAEFRTSRLRTTMPITRSAAASRNGAGRRRRTGTTSWPAR